MNSTDEMKGKEIEKLRVWALDNVQLGVFLREGSEENSSYYEARDDESTYIGEYDFNTLPELEKMFDELFNLQFDRKVKKVVGVCAMRCGRDLKTSNKENLTVKDSLPEHIYVF